MHGNSSQIRSKVINSKSSGYTYISHCNVPLSEIFGMGWLLEHGLEQMQCPNAPVVMAVALEIAMHGISVSIRPQNFHRIRLQIESKWNNISRVFEDNVCDIM